MTPPRARVSCGGLGVVLYAIVVSTTELTRSLLDTTDAVDDVVTKRIHRLLPAAHEDVVWVGQSKSRDHRTQYVCLCGAGLAC